MDISFTFTDKEIENMLFEHIHTSHGNIARDALHYKAPEIDKIAKCYVPTFFSGGKTEEEWALQAAYDLYIAEKTDTRHSYLSCQINSNLLSDNWHRKRTFTYDKLKQDPLWFCNLYLRAMNRAIEISGYALIFRNIELAQIGGDKDWVFGCNADCWLDEFESLVLYIKKLIRDGWEDSAILNEILTNRAEEVQRMRSNWDYPQMTHITKENLALAVIRAIRKGEKYYD